MTDPVAFDVVSEGLAEVHRRLLPVTDGEVASYIPQLALADPDDFGIALVSMGGHRYEAGSSRTEFTIQSVSKPFVHALALAELGLDEMSRWVGNEPSGDAFNAISLEHGTGRPANPMINAGAIATTNLVPADSPAERSARILDALSAFAGRRLAVDEEVYRSEAATGDRNRALAYLMHAAGSLRTDPVEAAEVYFRQCSVLVNTVDLAVMGATLANGGVNPVTREQVVPEQVAVEVLSVMATCGMYDAAGDWLVRVGLPAKSGVSGGLTAASPARFGIACYSPPLDRTGSSVRGVVALRELSRRFGMHLMHHPAPGADTVTAAGAGARAASGRERAAADRELLAGAGDRVALVAARGEVDFPAAERLLHALAGAVPVVPGWVVVDLDQVTSVNPVAGLMLGRALDRIAASGHRVAVVGGSAVGAADDAWGGAAVRHARREEALAWAEEALLHELRSLPH
ncbi:L-glutaminase [Actinacidiphila alni]|uniref:Glutaminase n=1 Tax=Actinacidiphila alni TaxID=380248 RepID=A0A1I2B8K4_9ACTN|nr:glutaminase A [Actinacidiphila alni]SFE51643.1 L-glutaminase [Actinacidiphila alni]